MKPIYSRALFLCTLAFVGVLFPACSHDLFTDSENRTQRQLRYYDNDSATQTTAARRQSVGSPFGMPQGGAEQ